MVHSYDLLHGVRVDEVAPGAAGGGPLAQRLHDYFDAVRLAPFGLLSFQTSFVEEHYTKGDTLEAMGATPEERRSGQLIAGLFVLRVCAYTRWMMAEWKRLMDDTRLVDDACRALPNAPGFVDHRHDQSVFSLLRKRHGSVVVENHTSSPEAAPIHAAHRI